MSVDRTVNRWIKIDNVQLYMTMLDSWEIVRNVKSIDHIEIILYDTVLQAQLSWSVAVTKLRRMNSKKSLTFLKMKVEFILLLNLKGYRFLFYIKF